MEDLPIEIYDLIIGKDPDMYLGMLVVRKFVMNLTDNKIVIYKERFTTKENNKTYF